MKNPIPSLLLWVFILHAPHYSHFWSRFLHFPIFKLSLKDGKRSQASFLDLLTARPFFSYLVPISKGAHCIRQFLLNINVLYSSTGPSDGWDRCLEGKRSSFGCAGHTSPSIRWLVIPCQRITKDVLAVFCPHNQSSARIRGALWQSGRLVTAQRRNASIHEVDHRYLQLGLIVPSRLRRKFYARCLPWNRT